MKKVLVVLLLCGLVVFCIIAGVGGFIGYKWHKIKKEGGTPSLLTLLKKEPPPEPAPTPEPPPEPQPTPPPEPQPTPQPEIQPPPTPQPAEPPPAPVTQPPKPKPKPAPKPVVQQPSPTPLNTVQPDNVRPPSYEPPAAPAPIQEPAAPAPKIKAPKGSLGVIFETEAEQGDVVLHVDEQLVEKQSFRASSQQKFRLTKTLPLTVGPHKVRITVVNADGKTVGKEWQVDVPQGGNPVWKAELSSSGRAIDLKQIQAK